MPTSPAKQDADASARGVEWYRSALADAEAEIQTKNKTIAELQRNTHRHVARIAQLTAENENLCKQRDGYKEQLEEAKEKHATELREVTEEMAAAARFSDSEWREHCDRQEAIIVALVKDAFEMLPNAEAAARRAVQQMEKEARRALSRGEETAIGLLPPRAAYQAVLANARARENNATKEQKAADAELQVRWLLRALGCTGEGLRGKFLPEGADSASESKESGNGFSTNEEGIYELYLALHDIGFPLHDAMIKLLKDAQVRSLDFNAVGHKPYYREKAYALPPTVAVDDFIDLLISYLPKLTSLGFSHLPPLSSWQPADALLYAECKLYCLEFANTEYTVEDLFEFHSSCPSLEQLRVHTSHCTDWGEYADIDNINERKNRAKEASGGIIWWMRDD